MNRRRMERAPRITIEDLLVAAGELDDPAPPIPENIERNLACQRVVKWLRAEADQRTLENETRRRVNEARRSRRGILG